MTTNQELLKVDGILTDVSEWDRLELRYATGEDYALMIKTPAYNYVSQTWDNHSTHAHFEHDTSPLMFCGNNNCQVSAYVA